MSEKNTSEKCKLPITIFIDFDGTIHESAAVYAPAFRTIYNELAEAGLVIPRDIPDEMVSSWLGAPVQYPWSLLAPDLDLKTRDASAARVGKLMDDNIKNGIGKLYPGTEETLSALKKAGVTLCILSNSTSSYMEMNRQVYHLDQWFDYFFVIADFPECTGKWQMFRKVRGKFPGRQFIMGDRHYDKEAAEKCGDPSVKFIACLYGYAPEGELDGSDYAISKISDVLEIIRPFL